MGCAHSNEKTKDTSQQKLSEEQIEQLLKTRFTRAEILDWHRIFIEKCGAGGDPLSFLIACINKQVFIDYFNQLHPNGDVTRLTETFFRTYDLNKDGTIDFMEFMNAVSIIRRGDLTEKLSFIFSLLDSNQEDYIDRLKLVQMMEALYNIKGINYTNGYNILLRKVDSIITRLDKDKEEGRILRNKFIESCMNDPALRDLLNVYK